MEKHIEEYVVEFCRVSIIVSFVKEDEGNIVRFLKGLNLSIQKEVRMMEMHSMSEV